MEHPHTCDGFNFPDLWSPGIKHKAINQIQYIPYITRELHRYANDVSATRNRPRWESGRNPRSPDSRLLRHVRGTSMYVVVSMYSDYAPVCRYESLLVHTEAVINHQTIFCFSLQEVPDQLTRYSARLSKFEHQSHTCLARSRHCALGGPEHGIYVVEGKS